MFGFRFRTGVARLLVAAAIALFGLSGLFADATLRPAQAQEMMAEFRETLGAYGRWIEHPRWGAVWVPAGIAAEWRPYRSGHWVYTDEWGWYWVADEEWGWIAYHYGRWLFDRDLGLGWIWCLARNGARPGCLGAAARKPSAGRRCRRKRSTS